MTDAKPTSSKEWRHQQVKINRDLRIKVHQENIAKQEQYAKTQKERQEQLAKDYEEYRGSWEASWQNIKDLFKELWDVAKFLLGWLLLAFIVSGIFMFLSVFKL